MLFCAFSRLKFRLHTLLFVMMYRLSECMTFVSREMSVFLPTFCLLIKSLMNTMHFTHEKQKVVMCIESDIHYVRMRLSGWPWKASNLAHGFWGSFDLCHLMPCGAGTPRLNAVSCVIWVQWGFLIPTEIAYNVIQQFHKNESVWYVSDTFIVWNCGTKHKYMNK
jgi:hypothetical protein